MCKWMNCKLFKVPAEVIANHVHEAMNKLANLAYPKEKKEKFNKCWRHKTGWKLMKFQVKTRHNNLIKTTEKQVVFYCLGRC